jgi:recombination protein RecR
MIFEKLAELFLKFPGIGSRQAKRFAYFLAGENKEFAKELAEAILEIKKDIKQCPSCFRFFEQKNKDLNICDICANPNRDSSLLMVVEKNVDFDNLEKTGAYNGKYFILGGVMALANGKENKIRAKELFQKIQTEKPKEVILALSATIESENTNRYIRKILEPLKTKVSQLGRGLSTGTELEYIDSETLNNALKNRG